MGGFSGRGTDGSPTRPVTSLVREGADFKTARLTCDFIHGLAAGQAVLVAKAIVGGSPINPFNGNFSVEEVLSPIAFTYRMSAAPTDDAQQSPAPPVFGGIWQVDRIICNRNIFELVGPLADAGTPFGVGMGALGDFSPQYIFQELIAKRNLIRNVDGAVDLDSAGITAQWVKNATVEANTFAGVSRSPITYRVVENLRQFHNQTQAGEVIQGRLFSNDFSSSVYLNQVETDVDLGVAGGASTQK